MKTIIVAFDKATHPTRSAIKQNVTEGDEAGTFARMRVAGETVDGMGVVELWNEDRGFQGRYIVSEPKATMVQKAVKTMKKITSLMLGLLAIGLVTAAQAQDPRFVQQDYTVGSALKFVPDATATNVMAYSTAIDVRKTQNITFTGNFKRGAAGTNTFLFFATSPTGAAGTWSTNVNLAADSATAGFAGTQYGVPWVWAIPDTSSAGDAAGIVCSTNFDVKGYGFIKLMAVNKPGDSDQAFTNVWMKYSYKISTP